MDIILLSILFPFRLTIFASIHLLSLCVPKWFIQQYSTEFNYIILLMLGLKLNQTLDYRKQLVSTQLIVFQHRSFADAYIINYINGPTSFVYRDILNSNIFVRYFINKFGGISVSSSTKGQTSQIFEFLKDTNKTLAIAPEDIKLVTVVDGLEVDYVGTPGTYTLSFNLTDSLGNSIQNKALYLYILGDTIPE